MGKVESFQISGCRCWFFTGDHSPPHFHAASSGEWELRVFFLLEPVTYEVKYETRKIPRSILKALLNAAKSHREDLFREWERNQSDD
ncbi:MAG: DUF4160 domain-containing protein [Gemmatimonadota bacterium]